MDLSEKTNFNLLQQNRLGRMSRLTDHSMSWHGPLQTFLKQLCPRDRSMCHYNLPLTPAEQAVI